MEDFGESFPAPICLIDAKNAGFRRLENAECCADSDCFLIDALRSDSISSFNSAIDVLAVLMSVDKRLFLTPSLLISDSNRLFCVSKMRNDEM